MAVNPKKQKPLFERGEVLLIDCKPQSYKTEPSKERPGVIISEEIANELSPNITVILFTTSIIKVDSRVHIPIAQNEGGVPFKCHALCDNIRTFSKERVMGKYGQLTTKKMNKIEEGIKIHLDLI